MRRRKPRVVWLPPTNANSIPPANTSGYQIFSVDVSGNAGDIAVGEIPLTIDGQTDELDTAGVNTLSDIENSGYRLRRIVGKIFLQQRQELAPNVNLGDTPFQVAVTAGIIVRRIDQSTALSLALASANAAELMSPGELRNYSDPWIWRRTWLLNDESMRVALNTLPVGPTSNYGPNGACSGNADGPHVDQKTARIISKEERLFLDVSSCIIQPGNNQALDARTLVITDLRVLASMTTSSGNRRNASR